MLALSPANRAGLSQDYKEKKKKEEEEKKKKEEEEKKKKIVDDDHVLVKQYFWSLCHSDKEWRIDEFFIDVDFFSRWRCLIALYDNM